MISRQIFKFACRSSFQLCLLQRRAPQLQAVKKFIQTPSYGFKWCYQFSTNSNVEDQILKLNEEFDQNYEAKKYDECLESLRNLIEIKEENKQDIRYEVQQTGHVLIKNKRVDEGLAVLYDLNKQLKELGVVDYLISAKIAENISKGEMIKGNLKAADEIFDDIIVQLEQNVSNDNPNLYDMLARNYSQRANIYSLLKQEGKDFLNELNKAKEVYDKFEELATEQKRSYAIVLQKLANALINRNEIELAEGNIVKSKTLWMELEKNEPIDPSHYSTLITFGVIELYNGRVSQAMKVLNQCQLDLQKKIKLDKSYSNSYMAILTIVAGICRSSKSKENLEKAKIDFDEGLKILKDSAEDDVPSKLLYSEYTVIRGKLFD